MADLTPQYTFLPWLRRGIVQLVGAVPEKERLNVQLDVKASGDKGASTTVSRKAELQGPGDVGGISARAIVRTVPRAGVRDFEANFLPAIEFYDEDFVWRYTPEMPVNKQLKPWLCLVVLTDEEFKRQGISSGKVPIIEITPQALRDAFPNPETTASWAHVHLNFGFPTTMTKLEDILATVQKNLAENPNLGCSRLLSPRRLKPNTQYTAFLLPAYEKGRLAGLGNAEKEVGETPNKKASWPSKTAVGAALPFPVYYEWTFGTASTGDFESLARQLRPADPKSLLGGGRLLDLQQTGWGQKYRSQLPGRPQAGAVVLESALKIPSLSGADAPKDPQEKLYFGKDIEADKAFAAELTKLLNLGAEPLTKGTANAPKPLFDNTTLEDDPFVVPPLYGSFYRKEADKKIVADSSDWYKQLNTNPVYRAVASKGTTVIQEGQEEYMDRAWDQLSRLTETRAITRRWQYSLYLSDTFYTKRLLSTLAQAASTSGEAVKTQAQIVNLAAPMHGSLKSSGAGNFVSDLSGNAFSATYSRTFAKLTRTGGPLMRRLQDKPAGESFLLKVAPAPPAPVNYLLKAIDEAIGFLNNLRSTASGAVNDPVFSLAFDKQLKEKGLVGIIALRTALGDFRPYTIETFMKTAPVPKNKELYTSIADQIRPGKTIPARLRSLVGMASPSSAAGAEQIEMTRDRIEFPEPMYSALADRDPNLIIPSLERIPPNSVTVMEPNNAFIEAYLLGLNHEMARECLWRELPAALDGTFFRQFWDVRNNPAATTEADPFKDIKSVRDWTTTTELGAAQHRPATGSGVSVIVVRGDLLRKYPNTLVFLQKAKWKDGRQRKNRTFDTTIKMPIFSAHIAPDYVLLGFDVSLTELKGDLSKPDMPGWFFGLKERVGDVHFGLDLTKTGDDPSWSQIPEVLENQCVDVVNLNAKNMPQFTSNQANQIARLFFQKPFQLLVHASQLLP